MTSSNMCKKQEKLIHETKSDKNLLIAQNL